MNYRKNVINVCVCVCVCVCVVVHSGPTCEAL